MLSPELRKQMAERSLVSVGRQIPWKQFLAKPHKCLGFFGGSVTQGYAHQQVYDLSYPQIFANRLQVHSDSVSLHCCAAPGYDSMVGQALAERMVLRHQPDFVVLEYAINETTLPPSVRAFEGLLRTILAQPNPPIVCILIMQNIRKYSCACFMEPIAAHYGLPCISLCGSLQQAMDEQTMVWTDFADEESHPHPEGHQLLADCLMALFDAAAQQQTDCPLPPMPEPWIANPYQQLHWIFADTPNVQSPFALQPRADLDFPVVWLGTPEDTLFSLVLNCRTLVVMYEMHHLDKYGDCCIELDGMSIPDPVIRTQSLYGWGNPRHRILVDMPDAASHRLTLTVTARQFHLLAIGYAI